MGEIISEQWRRAVADSWWQHGVLVRDATGMSTALVRQTCTPGDSSSVFIEISGWGPDALALVSDLCSDVVRTISKRGVSVRCVAVCTQCAASGQVGLLPRERLAQSLADGESAVRCSGPATHRVPLHEVVFSSDELLALQIGASVLVPPRPDIGTLDPWPLSPEQMMAMGRFKTMEQALHRLSADAAPLLGRFVEFPRHDLVGKAASGRPALSLSRDFVPYTEVPVTMRPTLLRDCSSVLYLCRCEADGGDYAVKALYCSLEGTSASVVQRQLSQAVTAEEAVLQRVGQHPFVCRLVRQWSEERAFENADSRWPLYGGRHGKLFAWQVFR
jgi:hypothetical protein